MRKIILSIFAASLLVFSCSNDDDMQTTVPLGEYENGIFVVGEGGFTTSGTLSYLSNDLTSTENGAYFNVNNEELGSFFQSIGLNDDLAYMVVDNGTINIANRYTLEKQGTISAGLMTPRFIAFANGKAYVSNWGDSFTATDDFIAVVDLSTNTVESTIAVSEGPEQLLVNGNKLFVSHKGGFGINNSISVINTADNTVVDTITVNDKPDEMIINNAGELVVLSEGATLFDANFNVIGHTEGAITKIDTASNTITSIMAFANGVHPGLMSYANGTLYYELGNKIYSLLDADTTLPTTEAIDTMAGFAYGMSVSDNMLFVSDASFSGQSQLMVFDMATGSLVNTFEVALGASKIYFNQ